MFKFDLHTTGRVYRLYAQTSAIREEWLNAIIGFIKETNPSFKIRRPESGSGSVPTINIFSAGMIIPPDQTLVSSLESITNKALLQQPQQQQSPMDSDKPPSDKPQPKIDDALDESPISLETPTPPINTSIEREQSPFDPHEHMDAIQTGYLYKTPGKRDTPGGWQRRWFILTSKRLIYYKNHVCFYLFNTSILFLIDFDLI